MREDQFGHYDKEVRTQFDVKKVLITIVFDFELSSKS